MPTIALVVIGPIIGAAGIAFAIWSIIDTNKEHKRRKRGVSN